MLNRVPVRSGDSDKMLGEVSVSVVRPTRSLRTIVLAHGAGGDMNTRLLLEIQERLVAESTTVVRFNFLYSEKKRRVPDKRPQLESCWRSVADWVKKEIEPESLYLGGKSMGGRMASYLVADGYPCRGIFFLGYPLHPPGKTARLRWDHLPRIGVPMIFIQGSRDSLCHLDLLKPVLSRIGSPVRLHVVEGGDHSFQVPKGTRRNELEILEEIVDALRDWMESAETGFP